MEWIRAAGSKGRKTDGPKKVPYFQVSEIQVEERERERELREFALILTPDLAVFSHIKASSEQSLNGFGAALLRGPKGAAEDTNLSAVTGGITVKV